MDTRPPLKERLVRRMIEALGPQTGPALDQAAKAVIEELIYEVEAIHGDDLGLNRLRTGPQTSRPR